MQRFALSNSPPYRGVISFCPLFGAHMTQSIPDGMSFSDLQSLAENAPHEADCHCEQCVPEKEGPFAGLNQEQVEEACGDLIEKMNEICDHPQIAKSMIWRLNDILLAWHSRTGITESEEGSHRSAAGWLRDAGKFQAIANILATVSVGPDDYLVQ